METPTLKQLTGIIKEQQAPAFPKWNVFMRKLNAGVILFLTDAFTLTASLFASLLFRDIFWAGELEMTLYLNIIPVIICISLFVFYVRGLYPGFGNDVIGELRTITYSITIVFAVLGTMTFLVKGDWEYSRLAFLMSWGLSLFFVPIGRSVVRKLCSKRSWWGIPILIMGAGKAGEEVIKSLKKHSHLGLRPVVAIDDDVDRWGYIDNVPVVGGLDIVPELSKKLNIDYAIIAMPSVSRKKQKVIIDKYSKYFEHTTVIPDIFGLSSIWVSISDFGGILGLEVQQKLLKRSSQLKKRLFDIILSTTIGIFALPLICIVSLLIKLDSKGKIFFRQERMGIDDSRFEIVKFRTMHIDAENRLKVLLNNNPDFKAEYDVYHKLKQDPRLTKVGKFLRKFSIDELPQFWNVIKGEMSLIGPRAYMPWEKVKMDSHDEIILKVKPGISGLWQVTDRNQSSFEERLYKDVYYIRNWSMFLDFYILARTISVVFLGKGA